MKMNQDNKRIHLAAPKVRLAVLDAKKEMRDGAEGSGSISSSGQLQDDGGVGFSGMLSLVSNALFSRHA